METKFFRNFASDLKKLGFDKRFQKLLKNELVLVPVFKTGFKQPCFGVKNRFPFLQLGISFILHSNATFSSN